MSKTTMYGIKNCDTIKKAKKWLEGNDIEFENKANKPHIRENGQVSQL
jgi:arsenate reductase-like glutaredoxin family protein